VPFLEPLLHVLRTAPGTAPRWSTPRRAVVPARWPPSSECSEDQEEEQQWKQEPEGEEAKSASTPVASIHDHRFTVFRSGRSHSPSVKTVLIGEIETPADQHHRQHDRQHLCRPIHCYSFLGHAGNCAGQK